MRLSLEDRAHILHLAALLYATDISDDEHSCIEAIREALDQKPIRVMTFEEAALEAAKHQEES